MPPAPPELEPAQRRPARQTALSREPIPFGTRRIRRREPPPVPLHRTTIRRTGKAVDSFSLPHKSYKISQSRAHFLRRSKQAIFGGFFRRTHQLSDGPEPHAL